MRTLLNEVRAIIRLIRRYFYMVFRKAYVRKMVASRKGICGRHGCCDLSYINRLKVNYFKCLDKHDRTRCLIWNELPEGCRIYPFDEKDKSPETVPYCNFTWIKNDDTEP